MKNAPDRRAIEGADEYGNAITKASPLINFGWRTDLAERVPAFRRHGTYDAPANYRRLRRAVERAVRKAAKKANRGAIHMEIITLLAVTCLLVAAAVTLVELPL